MNREQKLVDICFQLILTALDKHYVNHMTSMSKNDQAQWVAEQLKACGFETKPCGSSWGVLTEK